MGDGRRITEVGEVLAGHDRCRRELIPILQDVRERLGLLPPQAMGRRAGFLPSGEHRIGAGRGTACHVRGSSLILEKLSLEPGISPGETTEGREFDA